MEEIAFERKKAPLIEILKILKRYRKKNSLWFLFRWVVWKRPDPEFKKIDIPMFMSLFGIWDEYAHQLWAIYIGLKSEIGSVASLSAVYEIYQLAEKVSKEDYLNKLHKKFGDKIPLKYIESKNERAARYRRIKSSRLKKN